MSFMAGLAEGFGKTFNAMEERRGALKQDAFRIAYDSYLKKQAKYAEDEKQDSQWVATAKQIAAEVGATPEAWEHAYTMLKEGSSYEQAAERMARTKFSKLATPAMGEDVASLVPNMGQMTQQAGLTMDNTAKDAGLDLTQPNAEENPDILGSMTSAVGDIFNPDKVRERQAAQASKSVMSNANISQEEFDRVNAGYSGAQLQGGYKVDGVTPKGTNGGLPTDFKWTDAPVAIGPDGAYVGAVLPMGEGQYRLPNGTVVGNDVVADVMARDDYNARTSAGEKFDTATKPIIARKSDAMVAIRGFQRLSGMASENKAVLTQVGQTVPAFLQKLGNEGDAILKQFNVDGNIRGAEEQLKALVASVEPTGDQDAAQATAFMSLLTPIVFAYARANNGSGTLTQQDFKSAFDSILSTTDPTQFDNNLREIAGRMVEGINLDAKLGSQTNTFDNAGGWKLNTSAYDPMDSLYSEGDSTWIGGKATPATDPTAPQGAAPKWQANEALAKELGIEVGAFVTIVNGKIVAAK